jgi:hypothetical protein
MLSTANTEPFSDQSDDGRDFSRLSRHDVRKSLR